MSAPNASAFSGNIPENYDAGLVPVLMVPFAQDLSSRATGRSVLELAAGTGVLTAMLCRQLGDGAAVTATDLNDAMLAVLTERTKGMNVTVRTADACDLPFADETFDSIAAQFGVMFFPDKPCSFVQAHRVLEPGGKYVFNVWDSLDHNDFARVVNDMLREMFPENPPKFYETPFGFHDIEQMVSWLEGAGFSDVHFERVTMECTGPSVAAFCRGLIDGNPVSLELAALGGTAMDDARNELERRFTDTYGDRPFSMKMQAIVFEATKR